MESKNYQARHKAKRHLLSLKFASITVASILAFTPMSASSGDLKSALDHMFLSNSTSPTAFNTQSRGGFAMGSVVVRSPIKPIRLIAFDPPRISGGCGGIDMYGGSFSFINKDALISLFRQIAANAISALFWYAIKNISEPLADVMSKFQSLIQAMNLGAKNTCAIANQIIKPFTSGGKLTDAQNEKGIIDSLSGAWTDLTQSWDKMFETGNVKPTAMSGGVDKGSRASEHYGNSTWKALVRSNAASSFQIGSSLGGGRTYGSSAGGDQFTMEIIQSVLGTVITKNMSATPSGQGTSPVSGSSWQAVTPNATSTSSGITTGDPSTTVLGGTANAKAQSDSVAYQPTVFSIQDFVKGPEGDSVITILACANANAADDEDGCNNIVTRSLTRAQWPGIQGMVYKQLFGSDDGLTLTADSMIKKVTQCGIGAAGTQTVDNPCGFTAQQQSIINTSGVPILALLHKAQGSEVLAVAIAEQMKDAVVAGYTYKLMQSIVQVATGAYSGVKGVAMSSMTQDTINEIRREYNQISTQRNIAMQQTQLAMNTIDSAIKNLPSAVLFR